MTDDSNHNKNTTNINKENIHKKVNISELCNFGNRLDTITSPHTGLIAGVEYTPHKLQGLQNPSDMWIDKNNLYDNIGYIESNNEDGQENFTSECNKLNGLYTIGRGLETLGSPVSGFVTGMDHPQNVRGLQSASDMRIDGDGVTSLTEQNPYINSDHHEKSENKSKNSKLDNINNQFDTLNSQKENMSNSIGRVPHKSHGLQSPSEMWIDKNKLFSDGIKHDKITKKYLKNLK
ncbi:MAG: hypothetical protein ACLFMM_00355 [Methanohalobium sp.]|uniref:hypothetical protein n=1 Tax=Methanohalobium sp. TaxID=2837493 RepID=UPI0039799884